MQDNIEIVFQNTFSILNPYHLKIGKGLTLMSYFCSYIYY